MEKNMVSILGKIKNYERILIVVDMVNGFVREGALADPHIASTIGRQQELIEEYIREGQLVILVKDTHTIDSVEHDRFGGAYHCLEDTEETQLVEELQPYEGMTNTITLKKNSTSFVWGVNEELGISFIDLLANLDNLKQVDVCGCCTDICIINGVLPMMNYFDQNNRRVKVYVHQDAIDTFDIPGIHDRQKYEDAAYLLMEQQGAVKVKKMSVR